MWDSSGGRRGREGVGLSVFVKGHLFFETIGAQERDYPLLLLGREPAHTLLVAVVGALAAQIVRQGYAQVVPRIAAVKPTDELLESPCEDDFLSGSEEAALPSRLCPGHDAHGRSLFLRNMAVCQMAQALCCPRAIRAGTHGPAAGNFVEIKLFLIVCHNV